MKKINITELLIFIVSAELTGALSRLLSGNSFEFFETLTKPPFSPPGWIFPIVWFILYALMGFAAYLIYKSDSKGRNSALVIYWAQLFLNFLWSIVFFRFNLTGLSVAVILALLVMVTFMIFKFGKINTKAAAINIPYLLWLLYASYLNIGILSLN
ncbi:MAG: tryptophan-rich sensory protein [Oscillospiraceae bacterium]|nr:tryptophan-rich sensory protein [Oscillospiraceae bacterium]